MAANRKSDRMISIYPGPHVESVLGWGSGAFNAALQIFTRMLDKAPDLKESFPREQLQELRDILHGLKLSGNTVGLRKQIHQVARQRGFKALARRLAQQKGDLAVWKFWFGLKAGRDVGT